jgi:hypothetical protein
MTVVHRITGYDKRRGNLTFEHDIPRDKLRLVRYLARVVREDSESIGSYELTPDRAKKIARLIHRMINVEEYDWFLEPFSA